VLQSGNQQPKDKIMSQVGQLYRLQQIDTEIRDKKARLGEVLRLQTETAELLAARAGAKEAAAELQTWQTQQRGLNLELAGVNDKARRSEQRLYSGNVKNPKELTDLQNEIEALGRRRAALEDEIIEAMIMVEDVQATKAEADELLATVQTQWEQSQSRLRADQNELALRLNHLLTQRQQTAVLIDGRLLAEYDQMRQRKGGVAVAGLQKQLCLGCRLNVSEQIARRAERGEIVYCGGCGRILYPL